LKDTASALEEGKADILGLYMVSKLYEKGEINDGELMDNYVTFLAGIFRSVRFGASSAHGRANMVRFNFFKEAGAFSRAPETGYYSVNFDKMTAAIDALSNKILTIQGDGDYEGAQKLLEEQGIIDDQLASDLKLLEEKQIPVDVVFNQGKKVLGLD
ncbi:MAG TPA: Zn-dependent hydrolase, partial [Kangiella sp.]